MWVVASSPRNLRGLLQLAPLQGNVFYEGCDLIRVLFSPEKELKKTSKRNRNDPPGAMHVP